MKDSPERSRVSNIIDHISLIFLFAELKTETANPIDESAE